MINNFDILAIMEMEETTEFVNIGKKRVIVRITEKLEKKPMTCLKRGVFTLVLWRLCLVAPSAFST